ncbi:MAG: hypothetical protein JSV49_02545, partial [Thermoplasmata archaeon]
MYEIKYESTDPNVESKSINMYDEEGKALGRLQYTINGGTAQIGTFSINEWQNLYAERLLSRFLVHMKRRKVNQVSVELYHTDNTSHKKLLLFKSKGFIVESGGNITGYHQYFLKKQMK